MTHVYPHLRQYLPSECITILCLPTFRHIYNFSPAKYETAHVLLFAGATPQCKPITCGQPPEVINARSTLINGSTLWQSFATYECKPGFRMENVLPRNRTRVNSMCTENGLWQPVSFVCVFDPLAISLEDGSLLEGNKTAFYGLFTVVMIDVSYVCRMENVER